MERRRGDHDWDPAAIALESAALAAFALLAAVAAMLLVGQTLGRQIPARRPRPRSRGRSA